MLPAQPNQSIISGIQVIEEIVSLKEPIGSRELARKLNDEPTRINRILGTLFHLGYVEKTTNNKYKAGPAIHILASLSLNSSPLLRCSIEPIKELLLSGHTVALGVLWKQQVSYLFHGNKSIPFEQCIGSHRLYPIENSSIGNIIKVFNKKSKLTDDEKLIIKNRYSFPQSPADNVSIAVPIGNQNIIAGLALAINKKDFNKTKDLKLLQIAAEKINASLKQELL